MKRQKKCCESCGSFISLSNFDRHTGSASCQNGGKGKTKKEKHPWDAWRVGEDRFRMPCGYVGTKSACRNKLNCRSALQKNPNGNLASYNKSLQKGQRVVHNKGSTTPPHHRDRISRSLKDYYRVHGDSAISPEKRKILSEKRSKYLKENPAAHVNSRVAGNRSKMTYPEKVAHDWFQRKKIPAIHNQRVAGFFPDFIVGKIIVEIDGERWHSSLEQKERDAKRDAVLSALGYRIYRIPSKERIESRLEEIFRTQVQGLT